MYLCGVCNWLEIKPCNRLKLFWWGLIPLHVFELILVAKKWLKLNFIYCHGRCIDVGLYRGHSLQ